MFAFFFFCLFFDSLFECKAIEPKIVLDRCNDMAKKENKPKTNKTYEQTLNDSKFQYEVWSKM